MSSALHALSLTGRFTQAVFGRSLGVGLPSILWWILGAFAVLAALSPNPGIGFLGVAQMLFISMILWRPSEPQALLFIVGFQWLQGFSPVLLALVEGEPIGKIMGGDEFESATVLTLLATGVFALGLRTAARRLERTEESHLRKGLRSLKRSRLMLAWIVLTVATTALAVVGDARPALRQGLIAIEIWKWAVVLMLFFRWLASGRGGVAAMTVLLVEVGIGMMGYFSSFKEVFFILLLAGTGVFAIGKKKVGALLGIVVCLLVFAGFWQAIKVPYRDFLSQGERAQVVNVSVSERIAWLREAVFEVDREAMATGGSEGLKRLGYVEYFGHALHAVPALIPHTDGLLWKEALLHPLMPRLLFPDKLAINDSDRTNAYTGMHVADEEQGTSISIGYVGESYIDFGRWGMFAVIYLWGWLAGWCYQFLRRHAPHPLLGSALGSCLLLSTVMLLETSNIKMTGSLLAGFLVTAVLMRFFGEGVWKWLTVMPTSNVRRARSPKIRNVRRETEAQP